MDLDPLPPQHMPIAFGPVTAKVKRHKQACSSKASNQENSQPSTSVNSRPISKTANNDEYISLMDRLAATSTNQVTTSKVSADSKSCSLCNKIISSEKTLTCINEDCAMCCHMLCLSAHFLANEPPFQLLPLEAACPCCQTLLLWGDLIRNSQGFFQYLGNTEYTDI